MSNSSLKRIKQNYPDLDFTAVESKFPVSLEKICDALNVYVDLRDDLPDNLSGKIFKVDENYLIYANKNHSPRRVRFTIAHEIGHLIKHKEYIDKHGEILERRDHTKYSLIQIRQEKEANQFAAELLMPEYTFIEQHEKLLAKSNCNYKNNDKIVNELAEYFWVSPRAVAYRIITLGLDCA
jgi:Zn-dependent peptidase ImmA (M78 family)